MLLAIDCGNTNTMFSIWDGTKFIATWRTATEWQRTADQYYVWLSSLMQFQKIDVDIDEVIISSTVPRVVFNLRVFADRYFNCRPLVVGKADCALPHPPRVDEGTQVGPDRLVNAAAGFEHYLTLISRNRSGLWAPIRWPVCSLGCFGVTLASCARYARVSKQSANAP